MKDKNYIESAYLAIKKIYKIRKEIVLNEYHKKYKQTRESHIYISLWRDQLINDEQKLYWDTISAVDYIVHNNHRFRSWTSTGLSHTKEDRHIKREVESIIKRIDVLIDNRMTNYKFDPLMREVKEDLEGLLVMSELATGGNDQWTLGN